MNLADRAFTCIYLRVQLFLAGLAIYGLITVIPQSTNRTPILSDFLEPPQQTELFDVAPSHCNPELIDPFNLEVRSLSFYRMPADTPSDACLNFVVDSAAGLILYVGETCRSNKRWKGIHDCKNYIESYQSLHYQYGMKTAVNIAFWWDTPVDRRSRQKLEQALIQKWKSPFNKEYWQRWGQPFG